MAKLLALPVLLLLAIAAAGGFGMLHNQLSFTVGPTYFSELKFIQFRIDPSLHNRLGAALVGWRASWWMGLGLGLPLAVCALLLEGRPAYVKAVARGIAIAFTTALACSLTGLVVALSLPDLAAQLPLPKGTDLQGFYRAALMHDGAYLGGLLGLLLALGSIWRQWHQQKRLHGHS